MNREYFRDIGRRVALAIIDAMKAPPEGHPFYGNQWLNFGGGANIGNSPRTITDVYSSSRQPSGKKVSDCLSIKSKGIEKKVTNALNSIDSVHGIEGLPNLEIKAGAGSGNLGVYKYYMDRNGTPSGIGINSNGDHIELTTTHEVGHFVDHQALGTPGRFSSEDKDSDAGKIVSSLRDTDSYKSMKILDSYVLPDGSKQVSEMSLRSFQYYSQPVEVFARAYSQYIATKSADPKMLEQLNKIRSSHYGKTMWTDDEFEPISKQFDTMFESKGWRK